MKPKLRTLFAGCAAIVACVALTARGCNDDVFLPSSQPGGTVVDCDGNAVAGATVYLIPTDKIDKTPISNAYRMPGANSSPQPPVSRSNDERISSISRRA